MRSMLAKKLRAGARGFGISEDLERHAVDSDQLAKMYESAPDADELQLKRDLSDICHRIGAPDWQNLLKTIFAWIYKAKDAERVRRVTAVSRLLKDVKELAKYLEALQATEQEKDQARQDIHELLKSFIKKVVTD